MLGIFTLCCPPAIALTEKALRKEETASFVSQEFVAVGPMSKNALKKPRGTRCSGGNEVEDTADIGQGDATSICVTSVSAQRVIITDALSEVCSLFHMSENGSIHVHSDKV